jgi:hypothetical protein
MLVLDKFVKHLLRIMTKNTRVFRLTNTDSKFLVASIKFVLPFLDKNC